MQQFEFASLHFQVCFYKLAVGLNPPTVPVLKPPPRFK